MRRLGPLLAFVLAGGCHEGPPAAGDHVLGLYELPGDFAVGLDPSATFGARDPAPFGVVDLHDVVALSWRGSLSEGTAAELDRYLGDNAYVVSLATGERVPGGMRAGFWMISGSEVAASMLRDGSVGVSFVPDSPLEAGWYVLALEWDGWLVAHPDPPPTVGGYQEDGVVYVRFHVGPASIWTRTHVGCGEQDVGVFACLVHPVVTGPIAGAASPFSLLVDGRSDPGCTEIGGAGTGAWGWTCPVHPAGTELLVTLEGAGVETLDGVTSHRLITSGLGESDEAPVAPRFGIDVARAAR